MSGYSLDLPSIAKQLIDFYLLVEDSNEKQLSLLIDNCPGRNISGYYEHKGEIHECLDDKLFDETTQLTFEVDKIFGVKRNYGAITVELSYLNFECYQLGFTFIECRDRPRVQIMIARSGNDLDVRLEDISLEIRNLVEDFEAKVGQESIIEVSIGNSISIEIPNRLSKIVKVDKLLVGSSILNRCLGSDLSTFKNLVAVSGHLDDVDIEELESKLKEAKLHNELSVKIFLDIHIDVNPKVCSIIELLLEYSSKVIFECPNFKFKYSVDEGIVNCSASLSINDVNDVSCVPGLLDFVNNIDLNLFYNTEIRNNNLCNILTDNLIPTHKVNSISFNSGELSSFGSISEKIFIDLKKLNKGKSARN